MFLKIVILSFFALTDVRADFQRDSDYKSQLAKASDGFAEICDKKEPVRVGCRECSCGSNGYELKCRTIDDCTPDEPSLPEPPNELDLDDDTEKPDEKNPIICKPRSSFADYCNNCICSNSGRDQACTAKFCPPGIYNEDGTLNKEREQEYQLKDEL